MSAPPTSAWALAPAPDTSGFDGAPWPAEVSTLLALRGVGDMGVAHSLLGAAGTPTDPARMPGLDAATERLSLACRSGETVGLIGDYDVDGITASTILAEALTEFGAIPLTWLPDRFVDGYGPSERAVRYLAGQGATLLVTVDCGTSSLTEISQAHELGMDVIVLDHHEPPADLPDVVALVNHKLPGSDYGSEPAACGIAYKAMRSVQQALGAEWTQAPEHIALAALGTVCDMVPLTGEQRDLVRHGLPRLRRTRRAGMRALAARARLDLARATEDDCGWRIGPRINAAGRMAHASIAFNLLIAREQSEVEALSEQLEALNAQRQAATTAATDLALADDTLHGSSLAFVTSKDVHPGVAGLVASRVAESLNRPALVLHDDGDRAVGSMRSAGTLDCVALLRRHSDLFERYGGHQAAAGCTLRSDRTDEARERLSADVASQLAGDDLAHGPSVEAEAHPARLAGDLGSWLARMAPFGQGWPKPTLLGRDVVVRQQRPVGKSNDHLELIFDDGVRAIAFGQGALAGDLTTTDIVYHPVPDMWGGGMQAEIIGIAPRS